MAAKYAKIDRVCSLDADFKQIHLFKVSEIFTILLYNINNLKLVKKRKKLFLNRNFPKLQFTIESGLVRPIFFLHKMY